MIRDVECLAKEVHDLVIVGGGVYGACAAREARLRGLSVCLVEKGDFGGATSSQSLKIIHGGLRYLQHLDFARMRQSIGERRHILRMAPHLVRPLPCLVPTFGHGTRGAAAFRVAMFLNDLISVDRNAGLDDAHRIPAGRVLSRDQFLRRCPGIASEGVTGGALWYDAHATSTERLLLAFLESAARAGARLANYLEVERVVRDGPRVTGVAIRDRLTGRTVEIRGRVVLNAAGPWTDRVLGLMGDGRARSNFRPSKAINLLVRRVFPGDAAVGIPAGVAFRDADGVLGAAPRLLFVVPWRGRSLVGTKHLPYRGEPDEFQVSGDEVDRVLAELNGGCPGARLDRSDVIAVHGGLLPERPGGGDEIQLQKHPLIVDHAGEEGIEGLVTVVGVKWTTARLVAAQTIGVVLRKLGAGGRRVVGAVTPVAGGETGEFDAFLDRAMGERPSLVPPESMEHLIRSHGSDYRDVIQIAARDPLLARPVHPDSPVLAAQIVHAAEREMVGRLQDAVLRRTELWLSSPLHAEILERCAGLVAPFLGWDRGRILREVDDTGEALESLRPLAWRKG